MRHLLLRSFPFSPIIPTTNQHILTLRSFDRSRINYMLHDCYVPRIAEGFVLKFIIRSETLDDVYYCGACITLKPVESQEKVHRIN